MKTSGFGQPASSPFQFSFGSKPAEDKPAEKPAAGFGFGKPAEEPAKPGLGFNFGKTEDAAPKPSGFSFGATSTATEGFKGLGATSGSATFGSIANQGNNAFQVSHIRLETKESLILFKLMAKRITTKFVRHLEFS